MFLSDKFFKVPKRGGFLRNGVFLESSSSFGSSCLPDKAVTTEKGVDANENSVRAHYDIMTGRQAKSGS